MPPLPPTRTRRRLMVWGSLVVAVSVAGVIAGLTHRPFRDLGAVCIFAAVGGAMMLKRGLYGSRGPSDGGDSDGWSGGDGGRSE